MFVFYALQPSQIRFSCLPMSRVECMLKLPSLDLVFSSNRGELETPTGAHPTDGSHQPSSTPPGQHIPKLPPSKGQLGVKPLCFWWTVMFYCFQGKQESFCHFQNDRISNHSLFRCNLAFFRLSVYTIHILCSQMLHQTLLLTFVLRIVTKLAL